MANFEYHHASDLSEWTTVSTNGGKLAWDAAGLGGTSGSQKYTFSDTGAMYTRQTIATPSTAFRTRFYVKTDALTVVQGSPIKLLILDNNGTYSSQLYLENDAGTLKLRGRARNDNTLFSEASAALGLGTIPIEVHGQKSANSTSSDGFLKVYINGDYATPLLDITGIDWWTFWSVDRYTLGVAETVGAAPSGTMVVDEVVWQESGAQIGILATPPTITGPGDTTLGAHGTAIATPCTVVVTDGSTATLRLQCTSGKGTVDLTDLDSGVSVSAGTRNTNDVTFSGTPTQVNNAALDIVYTGAGDYEELIDTAVVVTVDDGVNSSVSDTFTVTTVKTTVAADNQADLNATLATLLATMAAVGSNTMTVFIRDTNGTDTETSILTAIAVFNSGSGATFRGKRRRRRQ